MLEELLLPLLLRLLLRAPSLQPLLQPLLPLHCNFLPFQTVPRLLRGVMAFDE
jgi:hypothetical protein